MNNEKDTEYSEYFVVRTEMLKFSSIYKYKKKILSTNIPKRKA